MGRDLPPADDFRVRFSGGETADFGNGSDDLCGTSSTDTVISQAQAEHEGLDVEAERAWLATAHGASLLYNQVECAAAPEVCADTRIELQAEVVEVLRVEGRSRRPSESCPAEWRAFAYRVAVSVESEDGNLKGTLYARAGRSESDAGVITLRGQALTDLRNFEGQLPIELDVTRAHHAFMNLRFALMSDGSASGQLEPSVTYYDAVDARRTYERIGPDAAFGPDMAHDPQYQGASVLAGEGTTFTLSSYPGTSIAPLVDLRVRADAVEPAANVELTIWVDGQEVHAESVTAGTYVELGQHPFGTTVSVDVHNTSGAGQVRAHVLQDNCFVGASSSCNGQDCTAHVVYTAAHQLCVSY